MSNQIYSSLKLYPKKYAEVNLQSVSISLTKDVEVRVQIDTFIYNNFGNVGSNQFSYTPTKDQVVKISYTVGVLVENSANFGPGPVVAWIRDGVDVYSKSVIEITSAPANGSRFTLSGSSIIRLTKDQEVVVLIKREFGSDLVRELFNFITIENVESDI